MGLTKRSETLTTVLIRQLLNELDLFFVFSLTYNSEDICRSMFSILSIACELNILISLHSLTM